MNRWSLHLILAVTAASLFPVVATAKLCGDNVDGQGVPCSCGDTVVSDLHVVDDPVIHDDCASDGLIVRATSATQGVTIDLAGATLHGSGHGAGVLFVFGGPGGARLISTGGVATITGFRDGISAHGSDSVALVDGVTVVKSIRDGMKIDGSGYEIRASEVRDAGRDGFALGGSGYQITNTRALNVGHFGYFIMGQNATVGLPGAGNVSTGSALVGFNVVGNGHTVVDCQVEAAREGIQLNATHVTVMRCTAQNNTGNGMTGVGRDWYVAGNRAFGNANNGIQLRGDHVQDGGGNSGGGNRGTLQGHPPAQCEINELPCVR